MPRSFKTNGMFLGEEDLFLLKNGGTTIFPTDICSCF